MESSEASGRQERPFEAIVGAGNELAKALSAAIDDAGRGLFSLQGGDPESTTWECCRECYAADWAGHKEDCEGAARIASYEAALQRWHDANDQAQGRPE